MTPGSFVYPHTACLSTVAIPLLLATIWSLWIFIDLDNFTTKYFFRNEEIHKHDWVNFFLHQQNKNSENLRLQLSLSTQTSMDLFSSALYAFFPNSSLNYSADAFVKKRFSAPL